MKEKSIKVMLKLLSRIKELILHEGIYFFIHTDFILPLFWSKVYNLIKFGTSYLNYSLRNLKLEEIPIIIFIMSITILG